MKSFAAHIALILALTGCAHTPADDPSDPLESVNRVVFGFNLKADEYVARPVAKAYVYAVPEFARTGITNFFNNLGYPTVIVNDFLQAKFKQTGLDTGRFITNSVAGLAGFIDVASKIGLERNDEDFGQTFGAWGVGPGWYLMLPLLGPSSNRDLVGRIAGAATSVTTYVGDAEITIPLNVMSIIDARAQLLSADGVLDQQFDKYIFVRSAYLQHRENLVYDGHPPKENYEIQDDPPQ